MAGDHLAPARALLPGVRLDHAVVLGGSPRSEVRRVRLTGRDGRPTSAVVKSFVGAGEGWVRETSALAVLPEQAPTARLIAAGAEPPVVVMTDVGTGPSVAQALLGRDPDAAATAVVAWSRAIGQLHAATAGLRAGFRAALDARAGELPVDDAPTAATVEDAVRTLDTKAAELGVTVPSAALAELRGLSRRLGPDVPGAGALSPTDACPDNNVESGGRLLLVDFEGAEWRHVAWDVAYLLVPWPTCWCSWLLPPAVSARALDAYREIAAPVLPHVGGDAFAIDVRLAAAGWAMISSAWFLTTALGADPPPADPGKPTPKRRAMVLHRLAGVATGTELPALAELAANLRSELVSRWGELRLNPAPAFRARATGAGGAG